MARLGTVRPRKAIPKTGTEVAWKWVLTLVALTFLFVYLLNNIKPGLIEPFQALGYPSSPSLPSDAELVAQGEEWIEYQ